MSLRKRIAEQKKKAHAKEREVFSNICFFLPPPPLSVARLVENRKFSLSRHIIDAILL